jgi:hypothetical protein
VCFSHRSIEQERAAMHAFSLHRLVAAGRRLLPWAVALSAAAAPLAHAQQVLLAVDTGGNRVLQLDPFSGAVLNASFIVDANSAATYDFQTPRAAIQVGNQIWVSDQSPNVNAIYRFDLGGAFLGKIGGNVAGGGLSNVRGMRLIDGTVYVANAGNTNGATGPSIVRIDTNGTILGSFATTATGAAGTVGNSPWDVMALGTNQLLVSDGTSRGLQIYGTDGAYVGAFSAALNNIPAQMFQRANGNVLLAANGSQPGGSFGVYELNLNPAVPCSKSPADQALARVLAELAHSPDG